MAAVGLVIRVPNVIFVPANSPYRTVSDLIAGAKANPGRLNYGSSGSGGSPHMTMEMFKLRSGTDITHVPFRGAGPMLVEVVAGRLESGCDNMPSCIGHIRDGRLRALAVSSNVRAAALPDVPTLAEAGIRDFEATAWFGVQAPARTPRPIIERLGAEIDVITRDPGYLARIAELGGAPPGGLALYLDGRPTARDADSSQNAPAWTFDPPLAPGARLRLCWNTTELDGEQVVLHNALSFT